MRTIKTIAALFVAASLLVGVVPTPAKADVDVSFGFFYDNLTPHGSWYVSAQYGRVWQPSVYASDWNPYYDGHWVYTDYGWTWVSDYDWGTIPYHYGTWVLDARHGWVWVPGYTWAPAWVVFRTGNDYCGWAPVPPGYSVGASINIDPSFFVFVSSRDFLAPRVRVAVLPRAETRVVIQRTKVINNITVQNNIVVNRGPDVRVVERETGHRVDRTPIERVARVAPFERVSADRLRATSDKSGNKKLRATEPMPADRPLPDRGDRDRKTENRQAPQDRPQDRNDRSANQNRDVQVRQDAENRAKARADENARAQQKRDADQAKARANETARAQQKRDADQAKARADADRRAAEQQSRAQASATAKQRSERQQKPPADTKAQADAKAKAQAQAQAQAKAKAQADARKQAEAKKKQPDKKDQSNDQDKH